VAAIRAILAPTDFSPHAAVAVRYACGLAEQLGAALHLLHLLPEVGPVAADPMLAPAMPPEYFRDAEAHAQATLDALLDPAWGTPASAVASVRWGEGVEGIVAYAAEHAIDLVVIATHGRGGLLHALFGSTAERIIRECPCPVLAVRDPG
jgi:universal stress protein A